MINGCQKARDGGFLEIFIKDIVREINMGFICVYFKVFWRLCLLRGVVLVGRIWRGILERKGMKFSRQKLSKLLIRLGGSGLVSKFWWRI